MSNVALPRVLCIVGPTSSGKTGLGVFLAKVFAGEVINADARQLYKGCAIGTGTPKAEEVEKIPHHLYGVDAPTEVGTVAIWKERALNCIAEVCGRNHLPIVVGGTGLYIQALVDNYAVSHVPPQEDLRRTLSRCTPTELATLLLQQDPDAARVVDMKNPRRVMRALEVLHVAGGTLAALRQHGPALVDALMIGLVRTKEELHTAIDGAVDRMMQQGWVEEVRTLHASGVAWDAPAMTAIGYREIGAYLRGERSYEETVILIKQATRQYAKRQVTWFKRDTRIQWIKNVEEAEVLVREWKG